jgi:hypothetical protein
MPYITVMGMPEGIGQDALNGLAEQIQATVAEVQTFNVPMSEAMVFYQADLRKTGMGVELIAKIDGVFKKPERTRKILENLRVAINSCLEAFALYNLPQCVRTEAFIASAISPSECAESDIEEIRCPFCRVGGGGSDSECHHCHGSRRKA